MQQHTHLINILNDFDSEPLHALVHMGKVQQIYINWCELAQHNSDKMYSRRDTLNVVRKHHDFSERILYYNCLVPQERNTIFLLLFRYAFRFFIIGSYKCISHLILE